MFYKQNYYQDFKNNYVTQTSMLSRTKMEFNKGLGSQNAQEIELAASSPLGSKRRSGTKAAP